METTSPGTKLPIEIVRYEPRFRKAFRELNQAWIERYFEMEHRDHEVLGDPERYILQPGGQILIALEGGAPRGVCALQVSDRPGRVLELSKMGVDPASQGRGIGRALCRAALECARDMGAEKVYLESNTRLGPALKLYRSLGFREIPGGQSPYRRSNIQMECVLGGGPGDPPTSI